MSKINISLVGGQPAPVYNVIVTTNPDKIIFIYSQESEDSLNLILKEIHTPYEKILLDATNAQKISEKARSLAEQYTDDDITVNITGGSKPWAFFFSMIFNKASIVYIDQNNVLWHYNEPISCKRDFNFDMYTNFRLYGNPLENYHKFSDYDDKDRESVLNIKKMRNYNHREFNALLTILNNQDLDSLRNKRSDCFRSNETSSYVEWDKGIENGAQNVHIVLYNHGTPKEIRLSSAHAVDLAFNSGWFEYEVASLISKWDKAKEICLNCVFKLKPNIDKNEVDIIVNTGSKILFVECKTQINNSTDIDKFNSVVKTYGGTSSKALFVTDAIMKDDAVAKCKEKGIMNFSLQDSHLGQSPETALKLLLNSEVENINSK
jgi:hypothetical protein